MKIEFEATFSPINKSAMRAKLKSAGGKLIKKEFLQRRYVFNLPAGHERPGAWARVRDEGDKITISIKQVDGDKIENQKEICLEIDDFETGRDLFETLGCQIKAFQESRRELWILDGVEVTIDEWPHLEPFVELESTSEDKVRKVANKLGFDYTEAIFCSVDTLYAKKYNISKSRINNKTPELKFGTKNPFLKEEK